jgi:cysteine desulfurase / selenocysteine lyase
MIVDDYLAPARRPVGVYLANAAHGLPSAPVLDAVIGYLHDEAEIGGGPAIVRHAERMAAGYVAAARLIGAAEDEVAFVDTGNRALQSLLLSANLLPGDHVLVDRTCWGGTLDMIASLAGVIVDVMPVDYNGVADPSAVRAQAHPRTKCILLTWCPAHRGLINPAVAFGEIAAELGAWYFIDACQMLGQTPVDVQHLRCDGLAASGRKWLRGPRGTALLYASRRLLDASAPFMADQFGRRREDARRYEQGEAYFAGRLGLGVAIGGALAIGMPTIVERLATSSSALRDALRGFPAIKVHDVSNSSSIIGFSVEGRDALWMAAELGQRGITVGTIARTYAPLDMAYLEQEAVIRAAPGVYTSPIDLDRVSEAVSEILTEAA